MTTERVHFYSTHHLSIPMHIDRMWDVVESYEGGQPTDINDYLELYQIVLFVEHEIYPPGWDENRTESIKQNKGKIAASFSHINPDELPSLYQETCRE